MRYRIVKYMHAIYFIELAYIAFSITNNKLWNFVPKLEHEFTNRSEKIHDD